MEMLPSVFWARIWPVLPATIMFADKPHRLNERTSAQRFCVLTILLRYRTRGWATRAAGYRAAISCIVQDFGCRQDEAIPALRRPAAKKPSDWARWEEDTSGLQ